jgi:hypothetical protein
MWKISLRHSATLALGLACGLGFATQTFAQTEERAGTLFIDEILLRPAYITRETEGGQFSLTESSFRLGWKLDGRLSATVAVGSLKQRAVPRFYQTADPDEDLGFYEAYGQYEGVYGTLRMGLLPLNFGHDGYQKDRDLIFPRPYIYTERVVALRDFGISLSTSNKGFYTELIAHNGEVAEKEKDGDVWTTANWGWSNERNLKVQVSMQAGRTTPDSTQNGASGLAGFDASKSARWRMGAFSAYWHPLKWDVMLQTVYGEREQDQKKGSFNAQQFDLIHMYRPGLGAGLRYEMVDPDRDMEDDAFNRTSFALIFGSEKAVSRFFFIFSNQVEEGNDVSSDEFRLVWRIIPFF